MPIDLASVPLHRRGLSRSIHEETAGYIGQRVGDAAGLTKMGVNRVVLPHQARHCALARGGR